MRIIDTNGTGFDYTLAGYLTLSGGYMAFIEQTTPVLAWLGLLVGLVIGVQRMLRNHRFRKTPPPVSGKG